MSEQSMTIESKRGQYKVGEILKINDMEWIVTTIHCNGINDTAVFHPLADVVLRSSYVELAGESHPIRLSDLLEHIIDEYKRRENK